MNLFDTFIEIFSKAPKVSNLEKTSRGFNFFISDYPSEKKNWYVDTIGIKRNSIFFAITNGLFPIVSNLKEIKEIKIIDDFIFDYSDEILNMATIYTIENYYYQYIIFEYKGETYKLDRYGFHHIEKEEQQNGLA